MCEVSVHRGGGGGAGYTPRPSDCNVFNDDVPNRSPLRSINRIESEDRATASGEGHGRAQRTRSVRTVRQRQQITVDHGIPAQLQPATSIFFRLVFCLSTIFEFYVSDLVFCRFLLPLCVVVLTLHIRRPATLICHALSSPQKVSGHLRSERQGEVPRSHTTYGELSQPRHWQVATSTVMDTLHRSPSCISPSFQPS